MRVDGWNTMPDGTCITIKAQYYKNGFKNLMDKHGTFACTGVMEVIEDEIKQET